MLKNSARNCAFLFSLDGNGIFFISEKSNARSPGPSKGFRAALPNVFGAGMAKAFAFQKLPVVFAPLLGSPIRFGRSELPPVLLLSPLRVGVSGRPACKVRIPPICQSPRIFETGPELRYACPCPNGIA